MLIWRVKFIVIVIITTASFISVETILVFNKSETSVCMYVDVCMYALHATH